MSQVSGTGKPQQRPGGRKLGILLAVGLGGMMLAFCIGGMVSAGSPDRIGPPEQAAADATAAALARATQAQHVCYGWQLDHFERGQPVTLSLGSNAGGGVSVRKATGCDRWLVVVATVRGSSKRHPKVLLQVIDSRDESSSVVVKPGSVGMTEKMFLADTGAGVLRAAGALPLIAAENGMAQPVAAQPVQAKERALPSVGYDILRGRGGSLLVAIPMMFLALASSAMLIDVLRRRRAAAADVPVE
ncbi:hypothetical protein [Actinoplanes sp. NPDC049681]|uniref:hypothetical protein n=1 Tax=Actinoplanes sp. NPDC049681 TaxID=3363905 RepID=UPI00378D0744